MKSLDQYFGSMAKIKRSRQRGIVRDKEERKKIISVTDRRNCKQFMCAPWPTQRPSCTPSFIVRDLSWKNAMIYAPIVLQRTAKSTLLLLEGLLSNNTSGTCIPFENRHRNRKAGRWRCRIPIFHLLRRMQGRASHSRRKRFL